MDVVRTNVEKIGGTVMIESRLGWGAKVRMKIPLTLAIIPALTITSAGDRYAIPQVSLLELVRLEGELERVRATQSDLGNLAETMYQVPLAPVRFAELLDQLRDWEALSREEI